MFIEAIIAGIILGRLRSGSISALENIKFKGWKILIILLLMDMGLRLYIINSSSNLGEILFNYYPVFSIIFYLITIIILDLNKNLKLWRGIDFQLQMTGAFGHKVFNGPRSGFDRFDDNSNYRADYDAWTPDNKNAKDPRPIYQDGRNTRGDQDRWIEDGSYLRVKQLALGYSLPKVILGNNIDQVRVFVNAQNIITFTGYTGLDPEFRNSNIWERGYDYGAFPNPKTITLGAQITF